MVRYACLFSVGTHDGSVFSCSPAGARRLRSLPFFSSPCGGISIGTPGKTHRGSPLLLLFVCNFLHGTGPLALERQIQQFGIWGGRTRCAGRVYRRWPVEKTLVSATALLPRCKVGPTASVRRSAWQGEFSDHRHKRRQSAAEQWFLAGALNG